MSERPLVEATSAQLQALLDFSLVINQPLELDEILHHVVHHARDMTGSDNAGVVLVDTQRNQFEHAYSTNDAPVDRRVRRAGGATRWIVDNRKPAVVPDTRQDRFESTPMGPESGILAYLGVPLQHAEGLVGVLYALSCQPRRYGETELEVMQAIGNIAALALYNSRVVASLRELNDYMGALLQVAAHDLRNPLASALGALGILGNELIESPTKQQRRSIEIIEASLARMEDLVEGILNYERWSGGQVDWQPYDLNSLARRVVNDYGPTAAEKLQRLAFEPIEGPLVVVADEMLLREAIGNLVSNASKYTPAGGHITVRTGRHDSEYVVVVEDDGPGVAPQDQERLFQPFVRLTAAARQRGSGLGLSIVKKIAERHGGHVGLESTPGEGARFYIFIPEMTL